MMLTSISTITRRGFLELANNLIEAIPRSLTGIIRHDCEIATIPVTKARSLAA
jgi:hypothetical protein